MTMHLHLLLMGCAIQRTMDKRSMDKGLIRIHGQETPVQRMPQHNLPICSQVRPCTYDYQNPNRYTVDSIENDETRLLLYRKKRAKLLSINTSKILCQLHGQGMTFHMFHNACTPIISLIQLGVPAPANPYRYEPAMPKHIADTRGQ